jgi:hypothetical protein
VQSPAFACCDGGAFLAVDAVYLTELRRNPGVVALFLKFACMTLGGEGLKPHEDHGDHRLSGEGWIP